MHSLRFCIPHYIGTGVHLLQAGLQTYYSKANSHYGCNAEIISLYFVKYSLHVKVFQTKGIDHNEVCRSYFMSYSDNLYDEQVFEAADKILFGLFIKLRPIQTKKLIEDDSRLGHCAV
jgi:hypothetical protein